MFTSPLRRLLQGSGPLKERVVRGGVWLLLGEVAVKGGSLLKVAILARLLSPHDFGLMGIALVVVASLDYFTETGVNAALVQRPGDIRPYLDTAWTIQVLRGVGVAVILLLGAPLGAWGFGNPAATPIIRAVGLVTMLRGFANPAVVYLRKELDFRREVILRLSGLTAGLVGAVPLAIIFRSVWALVLSVIAAQAAETLVSYWIQPYRPRLRLEWARARDLMRFGKWISWIYVMYFLSYYTDSLAVGKILGATALGFYQMAQQFAVPPTAQIGYLVHGLMFSTFSKLQGTEDLRRAFLWTLVVVSSVVVPIGCFFVVFGGPLVPIVLGTRWISISPALQILAWAGVATALTGVAEALFLAIGKPDLPARAWFLKVAVLAGLLYPLMTRLAIAGVALAVTTSALVATAYEFFLIKRLLRLTGREMLSTLKVGALGSLPFLGAGLLVSSSLVLFVGLAIAAYLTILITALRPHFSMQSRLWSSGQV